MQYNNDSVQTYAVWFPQAAFKLNPNCSYFVRFMLRSIKELLLISYSYQHDYTPLTLSPNNQLRKHTCLLIRKMCCHYYFSNNSPFISLTYFVHGKHLQLQQISAVNHWWFVFTLCCIGFSFNCPLLARSTTWIIDVYCNPCLRPQIKRSVFLTWV